MILRMVMAALSIARPAAVFFWRDWYTFLIETVPIGPLLCLSKCRCFFESLRYECIMSASKSCYSGLVQGALYVPQLWPLCAKLCIYRRLPVFQDILAPGPNPNTIVVQL